MIIEDTQELLVACLKALGLKLEEVIAVMSWLRTENQMLEMLIWLEQNHERKPGKVEIVQVAYQIKEEVSN